MQPLYIELLEGVVTLLAVAVGSGIALLVYFRQKEYELVKQRYLEGAVDIVAAQLEASLGVVSHNWTRCMQLCKSFRDTDKDFDVKELGLGFLQPDLKFQQIAHHRIGSLLQSQVVWEAYQSAMAYATTANSKFAQEVPETIRLRCTTDRISQDHATLGAEMARDMHQVHQEGFRYGVLLRELHSLGLMLEAERLNLKAIADFHKRPEIKELIQRLRAEFPEHRDSEGLDEAA